MGGWPTKLTTSNPSRKRSISSSSIATLITAKYALATNTTLVGSMIQNGHDKGGIAMSTYYVEYRLFGQRQTGVNVGAKSKAEAYDKAVYELIPRIEGELPYSAWVASVTYQNGNYRQFNTFDGKPY
jgi:hypothetical protein